LAVAGLKNVVLLCEILSRTIWARCSWGCESPRFKQGETFCKDLVGQLVLVQVLIELGYFQVVDRSAHSNAVFPRESDHLPLLLVHSNLK